MKDAEVTDRLTTVLLSYAEEEKGIWEALEEKALALYGTIGHVEKLAAYIRIAIYEDMKKQAGGIWEDLLDVTLLAVDYERVARLLVTAWDLEEKKARKDLETFNGKDDSL